MFIRDYRNTENPKVRAAYGTLSGIVGIILNLLLFAGKFIAGTVSGSGRFAELVSVPAMEIDDPVSPWGPLGPVSPVSPWGPLSPLGPWAPTAPWGISKSKCRFVPSTETSTEALSPALMVRVEHSTAPIVAALPWGPGMPCGPTAGNSPRFAQAWSASKYIRKYVLPPCWSRKASWSSGLGGSVGPVPVIFRPDSRQRIVSAFFQTCSCRFRYSFSLIRIMFFFLSPDAVRLLLSFLQLRVQ